jgi:putative tryptophan/tyrosine transport system substrate-binding protein
MRRREFIRLLGGTGVVWPLAARAQQPAMPVIGWLSGISSQAQQLSLAAFLKALGDAGYVEGRNVAIEYRWAGGQYDRLPPMAAELVRRQVALIFTSTPGVQAAMAATTTIPIVFVVADDPVKDGLVASLNRPGGNVTGVTVLGEEIASKRLELLHDLVPTVTIMALLVNPARPSAEAASRELEAAARTLGITLHVLNASTAHDIDDAFASLVKMQVGALVIGSDPFFNSRSEQLAGLTIRYALPTIYQYRAFVTAGGLMSYGANLADAFRLGGTYAGRILKGEKPTNLPVQQATKVELYINLKTAKALGLTVPNALLATADEVIE